MPDLRHFWVGNDRYVVGATFDVRRATSWPEHQLLDAFGVRRFLDAALHSDNLVNLRKLVQLHERHLGPFSAWLTEAQVRERLYEALGADISGRPRSPFFSVLRAPPVPVGGQIEEVLQGSDEGAPASAAKLRDFVVRFVDQVGQGVSGISLSFEHAGQIEEQTTDGSGTARVRDSTAGSAVVRVLDLGSLHEALKARWQTPGSDEPWLTRDDALVVQVRDRLLSSVSLVPDKEQLVSLQPYVARVRLLGGFFDTSKSFLLPRGLPGARAIAERCRKAPKAKLLIVGHTDTAGRAEYNDALSLERAEALKDFLKDNADGWLEWYGSDQPAEKRWGGVEDALMIAALSDAASRARGEDPVRWFQRTRGLTVDGQAGPQTRGALVREYMALDGAALPQSVEITTHGCGENFPHRASGDGRNEADNRRVEAFFFDEPLGMLPPPPGTNSAAGSQEYPEWVRRAQETIDHEEQTVVRIIDELGLPVANASVRVAFADGREEAFTTSASGELRLSILEDEEISIEFDDIHELGVGEAITTPSGTHLAV